MWSSELQKASVVCLISPCLGILHMVGQVGCGWSPSPRRVHLCHKRLPELRTDNCTGPWTFVHLPTLVPWTQSHDEILHWAVQCAPHPAPKFWGSPCAVFLNFLGICAMCTLLVTVFLKLLWFMIPMTAASLDVILKPQKLRSSPEALCTLAPAFLGSCNDLHCWWWL